jgi:hypothetical protein
MVPPGVERISGSLPTLPKRVTLLTVLAIFLHSCLMPNRLVAYLSGAFRALGPLSSASSANCHRPMLFQFYAMLEV